MTDSQLKRKTNSETVNGYEFLVDHDAPAGEPVEANTEGLQCGGCGNLLARSKNSRPSVEWTRGAQVLFVIGILAGPVSLFVLIAFGRLGFGLAAAVTMGICGIAYSMPKVRRYRCWKCGWKIELEEQASNYQCD